MDLINVRRQITEIESDGWKEAERIFNIEKEKVTKGLDWFLDHVYFVETYHNTNPPKISFLNSRLYIGEIECVCISADVYGRWFELLPLDSNKDIGNGKGNSKTFPE